jgi:DNA-binding NarL/FixJ family response regulator
MLAMTQAIRVLIADDHPILRTGIASLLGGFPDMEVVGEAADGNEALALFRQHRPDVALMDLQMPGLNGLDAIEALRAEFPKAQIIVLTTYQGDALIQRALKAGAASYLLKSSLRTGLVDVIRKVHAGQRHIPQEVAAELVSHLGQPVLTARELDVLQHAAQGNANKRIAQLLGIGEETVKGYMKTVLAKLGANDRTHAVTIAVKRGIIAL